MIKITWSKFSYFVPYNTPSTGYLDQAIQIGHDGPFGNPLEEGDAKKVVNILNSNGMQKLAASFQARRKIALETA